MVWLVSEYFAWVTGCCNEERPRPFVTRPATKSRNGGAAGHFPPMRSPFVLLSRPSPTQSFLPQSFIFRSHRTVKLLSHFRRLKMSLPNTFSGKCEYHLNTVGNSVNFLTLPPAEPVRIAVIGGTGISQLEHEGFTVIHPTLFD